MRKVFVPVTIHYDTDGNIVPISIEWEDGMLYEIDKVTDVRRAASLKVGGQGIRYTCKINGILTYLFFEEGRWFVEAKY